MSYLIVVFQDTEEYAWFTDELFDETHVRMELQTMGISPKTGCRERHLRFELSHPLTPGQVKALTQLQEMGLFDRFFESDPPSAIEESSSNSEMGNH